MKDLQRFFWFCSGVNQPVLKNNPTEYNKYFSIGATVFFTALFAALSGGYALWFVFSGSTLGPFIALAFGLLWGLAIFNLDRYIVSSISKRGAFWRQLLQALPRLALAVLVAVVIARPLELKIFDKEIRGKLKDNYLNDAKARIDTVSNSFLLKYAAEINLRTTASAEADSLYKEINGLRYVLNQEIFGDPSNQTSGKAGYGSFAKQKEVVIEQKEERLMYLRKQVGGFDSLLAQRKDADGLNQMIIPDNKALDSMTYEAGFADRNRALSQIAVLRNGQDDGSTANAVLFISLLFIVFECLPVLVKLMTPKGPYDEEIHALESVRSNVLRLDAEKDITVRNSMQDDSIEHELNKELSIMEHRIGVEKEITIDRVRSWGKQQLPIFETVSNNE